MRGEFFTRSIFVSAFIALALALSCHFSLPVEGTALAQDRNATLPRRKATPPTKAPPIKRSGPTSKDAPKPRQSPCLAQSPTEGSGRTRTANLNGVKLEMVEIPAGSFCMGSPADNGNSDERPQHRVIVKSFYMGKYEVTQSQWQAVMNNNPSYFKGNNLPVEMVSWDDAIAFIAQLNLQNDGYSYRLPTEAEWEYACRAGTSEGFAVDLEAVAWYGSNSGRRRLDAAALRRTSPENYYTEIWKYYVQTHPVGTKLPNSFGLFDMLGNVFEWCQDWYHDTYVGAPTDGSAQLSAGQRFRVVRGGSFYNAGPGSASRGSSYPDNRVNYIGFRVVAVLRIQ